MLSSGDKLGQYEILRCIGAGGMGEVFRARDSRLHRDVAIKVLPAGMADNPDRLARFQREARAVAALNHPHIVTIYSVEHADGIHFLTMELVEGQALDLLICADGLALEQIVNIATELADALAAAHEKGIVHRDLKPANVMVTQDGRVKVLDFGLAKEVATGDADEATLTSLGNTQAGVVMGTPAYMSPEQISARPLDHRTDIFSLGVMLHEMATGRKPFAGNSSAELISSILRDAPASITESRPDLPGDLSRIIRRCLEKDPRHRIQTARDVSNEFRDLARQARQRPPVPIPAQPPAPASAQSSASHSRITSADSGAARADEGFWVAVLPFKAQGSSPDLAALAEGLTEDIVTGMSRFSYLRVVARSASSRFTNQTVEASSAAKELGARYIMEGTVRQAGNKVRIAAQLVDATSGAHLWAETYVHEFSPGAPFELQDELVPRIVSTVADPRGVLAHSMGELLRSRNQDALTPYEAVLRSFAYLQRISLEEHALARTALERAVEKAPGHCDAWAMLAIMYREEFAQGFNLLHDPLPRASAAAHRAIEIGPSNHLAQHALASVLFFRGEYEAFRIAADRAVALNPMDGFNVAYMGSYIANSGDLERGCALVERARALNPNFPGWYWLPSVLKAYRDEDYRTALGFALKVNMPTLWRSNVLLAAVYGQLGEWEKSQKALQCLETVRPGFAATARIELEKFFQPDLAEHVIDGLRKAGMTIAPTLGETATARLSGAISAAPHASGTTRADEGFWVAVLPFKSSGATPEVAALADGVSEEIVTGLSRFSYLRVIARGSTLSYANKSIDLRVAGQELSARYVMDGTLRQAGAKLRVAVQLVDAVTGANLWAETYEREFSPDAIFELQDDLVPRIVSTVADTYGVLPHNMSESLRSKAEDQLTPHEAVIRSFGYHERLTPDEHAQVRRILENAVRQAPELSDAWAMLSWIYWDERAHGFNLRPDPLGRALTAARRAIDAAPSNHFAHLALAITLFFQKDFLAFPPAAQRAVKLNPMDGSALAWMGISTAYAGDWEVGCAHAESAMRLNPNHPGWYWFPLAYNAYRKGDYRGALGFALKINIPGYFFTHLITAAAYGQLGMKKPAQKAVDELIATRPEIATSAREDLGIWFQSDHVEHVLEGLRKAGLESAEERPTEVNGR